MSKHVKKDSQEIKNKYFVIFLQRLNFQSAKQLKTDILVTEQIKLLKIQHDKRENKFQSVIEENLVNDLICYRQRNHP